MFSIHLTAADACSVAHSPAAGGDRHLFTTLAFERASAAGLSAAGKKELHGDGVVSSRMELLVSLLELWPSG